MASPKRSKSWGYEVERQAEKALQVLDPEIQRTGASAQKAKGWPDLASPRRDTKPLFLVVTKDKGTGNPLLVTLPMADLQTIAATGWPLHDDVYVQVKGRAATWIGGLFRELKACVDEFRRTLPRREPESQKQYQDRGDA